MQNVNDVYGDDGDDNNDAADNDNDNDDNRIISRNRIILGTWTMITLNISMHACISAFIMIWDVYMYS